ncbi:MAG: transcription-repair coupling factor [Mariprofundaceae bacterium]|nr:transcription-repair coupling factor [Mariprofundaceae bacterium]
MAEPQLPPSDCSLAWRLTQDITPNVLHVYICPDVRSYRQLIDEAGFFMQHRLHDLWLFPAWEVLPYDRISPHQRIVGQRFATLGRLLREPMPAGLLITSLPAWLQRMPPSASIVAHVWQLACGDKLDLAMLRSRLSEAGMAAAERVLAAGEFAVRGGVLDIWPANALEPLRIDLFGDEIESIRTFNPETQRSGESLPSFTSVPAREMILDQAGRDCFTAAFRARFPQHRQHPMLASIIAGRPHPGMESLLPLAYPKTARLQDYLPQQHCIFSSENIEEERTVFAARVRRQFEIQRAHAEPSISPQELFATETPIVAKTITPSTGSLPSHDNHAAKPHPMQRVLAELHAYLGKGWRILLVAHGMGQQEHMREMMQPLSDNIPVCRGLHDWPTGAPVAICLGFLHAGMQDDSSLLLVLTGRELLGQRLSRTRRKSSVLRQNLFGTLAELTVGVPVIHEHHGIGLFQGLESRGEGDETYDVIRIEYAAGAQVFVPVEHLDRLHRYTGEQHPTINKLGSEKWKRTRERVERDLLAMAHELIAIEAARQEAIRQPIVLETKLSHRYHEFSAAFPFEETDDQMAAIVAVEGDLTAVASMDRLICGDVGFGKTEVAMRAAFLLAASGKQVAVLVPTTVLANQHGSTFRERFNGTGIKIEVLSRLQGSKETTRIQAGMAAASIDIIIGTHRLLSDRFQFAALGLLIVDEEQRFGVRHKQKLKQMQAGVDLLTLSATPIPRTLHQTLAGLRSVSMITTPPAEREAIRTIVGVYDRYLANEAIRRELYRGGQVYYLHNHVKSIERIATQLREDLPEADIGIAHGQMTPTALDHQMMAFYEGRLNILVCTSIVESGLDVANANTLIVERADMLGLAQLHQIRGRVGRSHRQAYAYLFTPEHRALTADAQQRLQAIAEHTELGAGFMLARQDMEIRGAGNLLGAEQSGKMDEIGLDLYLDMLADAVKEVRGTQTTALPDISMEVGLSGVLPPHYIPQSGERLALYRRIAQAHNDDVLRLLFEEITDRFGRLPDAARMVLALARLRWRGQALCLSAIRATAQGWCIHFTAASPINPVTLMGQVQQYPSRFRLTPDGNLTLLKLPAEALERIDCCIDFLDAMLA